MQCRAMAGTAVDMAAEAGGSAGETAGEPSQLERAALSPAQRMAEETGRPRTGQRSQGPSRRRLQQCPAAGVRALGSSGLCTAGTETKQSLHTGMETGQSLRPARSSAGAAAGSRAEWSSAAGPRQSGEPAAVNTRRVLARSHEGDGCTGCPAVLGQGHHIRGGVGAGRIH